MMNKPRAKGLQRTINAAGYSISGLKSTFKNEEAFRQEIYLLPIILMLAIIIAKSGVEFVLLFGSYWLVLIAELVNSALESVVDRIGLEKHQLSGQAKDIGSALVMMAIALVLVTWFSVIVFR